MLSLEEIADTFGTSATALKLLLTVYVGYVFAGIHRKFLFGRPPVQHHVYFTAVGILLLYWNYGTGIVHSVICITVQYLIFKVVGTSSRCIAVSFPFQLTYLVVGYVLTSTDDYDIIWTMPHCILTLRLIGLSFDLYDGHRDQSKVTPEQKTLMVKEIPSLLEMFGFCYFIGGFIIGPQFPIRRYRLMVKGELTDVPGRRPNSLVPALRRCLSGTFILALQLLADLYIPMSVLYDPEFYNSAFWWRLLMICLRGHILFYQYVSIWMINEGICILSGLGFCKDGEKAKWDAVRNVKLRTFAFSRSFGETITCFNINTNQWVARYVYKRLRFLGNRTISHASTLLFLAVWHGYHEGYFTCFAYEFLVMTVEKPLVEVLGQSRVVKSLKSSKLTSWIPDTIGFLYVRVCFGYCVLDFSVRKWRDYAPMYRSVYYYGHIFYASLWILLKIYLTMTKSKKPTEPDQSSSRAKTD